MRMKPILKMNMEMTWIVIWSKITTRHNTVKQPKIKKKEKPSPWESESQYHFQIKSAIPQYWFDIDHEYIEDNFMTSEINFSKDYTLNVLEVK